MTFRTLNQKFLAPGAQALMIFGIIALCQPWNFPLHRYGVTLTLIGLVSFIITSKIGPDRHIADKRPLDLDEVEPADLPLDEERRG